MKAVALSLYAAATLLAGCGELTHPVACTADFRFGLHVTVADSLTEAPPASAVVVARSGTFVDSVGPTPSTPVNGGGPALLRFYMAGERPGTYDLTVRSPGYQEWSRTGIQVTGDECHVHTIALIARLQH